ncbi:hypothetical protein C8R44DRAFT_782419 [Mycena epipterygia]|nr:hypothetical protein C8R44DRAFT_782419 [Mycena epipterygia]
MDAQLEGLDSVAQATQLVEKIFQEVYEEFRSWKEDYAARTLSAVVRAPSRGDIGCAAQSSEPASPTIEPVSPVITEEFMEIWDCETRTRKKERVLVEVIRIPDAFPALPAHEYCTPTHRSIFQGDDPRELPFMPFADDPTFDHAKYLEEYDSFSWRDTKNPDVEVVVIETARRLHTDHQMQYRHIDETGVLPLELLDRNGVRGMIYKSRRRDFPDWPPDVPASAKRLVDDTSPPTEPDKKLALLVSTFCTNLNCVVGFCSTHLDPTPMPLTTPPTVKNERMKDLVDKPCGDNCFLLKTGDQPVQWSDDDTRLLRTILDFSPDTLPCDLATICAKPCFEVFQQRRMILPDAVMERKKGKGKTKPRLGRTTSYLKFDDLDSQRFSPSKPCRHDGPCDAAAQCACFLNKAHCENGCRCSRKCTRRWRGCMCTRSLRRCRTESCACYLAHRECDPMICLKCQAKDADADVCQNANIQRGRWKLTTVAPARWGMGLFMAETADADELIIGVEHPCLDFYFSVPHSGLEYIGELIYDPTTDSREPIAVHRGRNYLFELNSTLSVDGTYAGNDARYINHDAQHPNCHAKVRLVNGEHRIGIYATRRLEKEEEVLFNYGNHFFQDTGGSSQLGNASA